MDHPFLGRYAVVRSYGAGVHAGTVVSVLEGGTRGIGVILRDSRRLWRWQAREGIALSGVAQHGINAAESKVDALVPDIYVAEVVEIIPATAAAQETIANAG